MSPNYMMSELSTIFSKPGEGIHKHYCGVAIADVAMTGMVALVISKLTNKSFPLVFAALVALGIGVHAVLGVLTSLNKCLGLASNKNKAFHYNQGTTVEHVPCQGHHKGTCLLR
jgi:hypothetical protein